MYGIILYGRPLPGGAPVKQPYGGRRISWKIKERIRARLGSERGGIFKDPGGRLRVCLVYPNVYRLGMSNLGFHAAYRLFNSLDGCVCERAFLPDTEEMAEHVRTGTPLLSYESQSPVGGFDLVAFSIPFENDYLNVPVILGLAGVGVRADERGGPPGAPAVMAGGVAVSLNPEPLAGAMDFFMIGEGEEAVGPLADTLRAMKERGWPERDEQLAGLDELPFVYVPSFYDFTCEGSRITGVKAREGAKTVVRATRSFSLDDHPLPESVITTPDTEFRDTVLAEVERGCGRGCRFCAAGFLYMPPRWRDTDRVKDAIKRGVEATGKVGLVGAAVSEHPDIKGIVEYGVELGGTVTLSSLRLDMLDAAFLELLKQAGYRTVTMAPEAGSLRLRTVINKGLTDAEILESARLVGTAGFTKLKLYFLVGLPTETDADARAIVDLSLAIKEEMKKGELTLSVNPFIPKPFTPFQWHAFTDVAVVEKRIRMIKKAAGGRKGVVVKAASPREAFCQAYIARGDRRALDVVLDGAEMGLKRAVRAAGAFAEDSVYRTRNKDEILPWDLIDHGLDRDYLWNEYQRGLSGRLTPPCDFGRCTRCGVCTPEALGRL